MKNYSQAQAGKGKTAYRTPSVFRYQQVKKVQKTKITEAKKPKR